MRVELFRCWEAKLASGLSDVALAVVARRKEVPGSGDVNDADQWADPLGSECPTDRCGELESREEGRSNARRRSVAFMQ